MFFVPVDDIQYVEADGNYLWIYTGARRHLLSESIRSLEPRLPPAQFIRINRSYMINQYAIRRWSRISTGSIT
ncbi:LytR/AlgR family response regulator transcription factor [Spirosoma soli]|uniref:LytR/AlgR family response regulator transcription factor n=1 Tax=Spirosoma soli TaxID=1770529 RepID=A0ABW5LXE9_9BACT